MKNIRTTAINALMLAALCLPLSGCAKTVGQEFREIMADIDAQCRKDKMGPYLDKNDPEYFEKKAQTSCDILTLKPADPLATEEGRFAYSIKLPAPHDKPMVQYQKGMSAESYFKQLCEKEAGDFVFRSVDGVEGIKIMRPGIQSLGVPMLYEMPGSAFFANYKAQGYFVSSVNGKYAFVDVVEFKNDRSDNTQLIHYYLDSMLPTRAQPWGVTHYPIKESKARYGYTYRGLNRPNERENGILGGELIILDMTTNEVLAYRRIFYRSSFVNHQSVELMTSTVCTNVPFKKDGDDFIADVLKPAAQTKGNAK